MCKWSCLHKSHCSFHLTLRGLDMADALWFNDHSTLFPLFPLFPLQSQFVDHFFLFINKPIISFEASTCDCDWEHNALAHECEMWTTSNMHMYVCISQQVYGSASVCERLCMCVFVWVIKLYEKFSTVDGRRSTLPHCYGP